MTKPLAIDLCAGLGGWTEGLLATGWHVCGVDIERHMYGEERYPGSLWLQDILTLHGAQFASADLIVASPPCQFFSYTAMPWSRAKALAAEVRSDPERLEKELALFNACFRIQREACEAAGRHIPMVVENVRGAIPWVGRSRWNFGSFHFWGDVPALMPIAKATKNTGGLWFNIANNNASGLANNPVSIPAVRQEGFKTAGMNWSNRELRGQDFTRIAGMQAEGVKVASEEGRRTDPGKGAHFTSRDCDGIKSGGDWFNAEQPSISRLTSSKSTARKAASAMIAKIPFTLSTWIGRTYYPSTATPPAPDQAQASYFRHGEVM